MSDKRCDGCVNYHPAGSQFRVSGPDHGVAKHGQCRIGPPQPTAGIDLSNRWPLVWADEWCGCHLSKDGPVESPPLRVFHDEPGDPA